MREISLIFCAELRPTLGQDRGLPQKREDGNVPIEFPMSCEAVGFHHIP